ncbi:MAG: RNA polymerase sigma factor [Pyrinomonadaceae bacterium]
MKQPSPEELARWCQRTLPDDTRAFEALVSKYKQNVFATAYRLLGNRSEAEDAAQEVFLKIYRAIKDLAEPATLTTWIYRITARTCFDLLDSRKRRSDTVSLGETGEDESQSAVYVDAKNQTPEEVTINKELRKCLEKTLAGLDPDGRSVIVLRDVEDRSYQEIAEILTIGISAVKMRIHRARLAFQQLLDQVCPGIKKLGMNRA